MSLDIIIGRSGVASFTNNFLKLLSLNYVEKAAEDAL